MLMQVVAPSFRENEKYPDISRYQAGRTIGYLNIGDHSFYVQIILTSSLDNNSEQLMIIPILDWSNEDLLLINSMIDESAIEVFYLDRNQTISSNAYTRFSNNFKKEILHIDLKTKGSS